MSHPEPFGRLGAGGIFKKSGTTAGNFDAGASTYTGVEFKNEWSRALFRIKVTLGATVTAVSFTFKVKGQDGFFHTVTAGTSARILKLPQVTVSSTGWRTLDFDPLGTGDSTQPYVIPKGDMRIDVTLTGAPDANTLVEIEMLGWDE